MKTKNRAKSNRRTFCSNEWNVGACISGGITTAQPFKGFSPSGKVRKGEWYGRQFASCDDCFDAMHEYGYGVESFRRNSYFIVLRLSRRVRRHIAENPAWRLAILERVLPARDWEHFCKIREIHGAAGHDADIARAAAWCAPESYRLRGNPATMASVA